MTCKDCYHYAVCHLEISFSMGTDYMTNKMYDDMENRCSAFKDESKIIELPCKVTNGFKEKLTKYCHERCIVNYDL